MIRLGAQERTTARAGLPLVVEACRAVRLEEVIEGTVQVARRQRGFTEAEKITAVAVLIAAGGDRLEDIRILREDRGLLRLLGGDLPSQDALLDFLNAVNGRPRRATRGHPYGASAAT